MHLYSIFLNHDFYARLYKLLCLKLLFCCKVDYSSSSRTSQAFYSIFFFSSISFYLFTSTSPVILSSFLVSAKEKSPQSMILTPLCLVVEMVFGQCVMKCSFSVTHSTFGLIWPECLLLHVAVSPTWLKVLCKQDF